MSEMTLGNGGPEIAHPEHFDALESAAFLVDVRALDRNLERLGEVQSRSGAKILLALKGFAMWSLFPRIAKTLHGVTASSVAEARLGREKWGAEVHAYAPAYSQRDIDEHCSISDHIVFNSPTQWFRYRQQVRTAGLSCGLRVNPEHSEVSVPLYDPCAPGSRLGTTLAQLEAAGDTVWDGLQGLHFHSLCELGSDALERTLLAFETRFSKFFSRISWVNFGGGHHITREDYDIDRLVRVVQGFKARHGLDVYLEPGEAIALNTGVLVCSVLDILQNGDVKNAILDISATAHMPDVLEMPYRPQIVGAGFPGEKKHTYRLGGLSCLAGDIVGNYSFDDELKVGSKLIFLDMAHYTMVKTTTFNGVRLPSIGHYDSKSGAINIVREFGYEDYMTRLS